MLETLLAFIKSLPSWLMHVADIMIVAILFLTAMTFLAGIWCGLKIIGQRANDIEEVNLLPFKITFKKNESINNEKETNNG